MIKSNMKDITDPLNDKLNGIYRGVIEDNNDPDKLGRCKIRVFGLHSPNKTKDKIDGIPVSELPWSEPAMGLFQGSVSGLGSWAIPLQGSHVFLFFEAGNILQSRYFATVPGKPTDQNHGLTDKQGFSDPNNEYPNTTSTTHIPNELDESDFHRLSRGEITGTIIEETNANLDVPTGEPTSSYNATYPNNNVFATKSGITLEIDDTPNNERIHIYHPSKTYIEINKDGRVIIKNASDKYEIVGGNKKSHISVDDLKQVDGDRTLHIDGTLNISAKNGVNIWSGGNVNIDGSSDINLNSGIATEIEI